MNEMNAVELEPTIGSEISLQQLQDAISEIVAHLPAGTDLSRVAVTTFNKFCLQDQTLDSDPIVTLFLMGGARLESGDVYPLVVLATAAAIASYPDE